MNVNDLISALSVLPEDKKTWPVIFHDDMCDFEVMGMRDDRWNKYDPNDFERCLGKEDVIRLI